MKTKITPVGLRLALREIGLLYLPMFACLPFMLTVFNIIADDWYGLLVMSWAWGVFLGLLVFASYLVDWALSMLVILFQPIQKPEKVVQ